MRKLSSLGGLQAAGLAVLVGSLLAGVAPARDMAALVPENAAFAVWLKDATKYTAAVQGSPVGRLFEDAEMKPAREWLYKQFTETVSDVQDREDLEGLVKHLKGSVAFYVVADANNMDKDPVLLLLAETDEAGREFITTKLNPIEEADVSNKDTFTVGDVTVYRVEGVERTAPAELINEALLELDPEVTLPKTEEQVTERVFHYATVGDLLLVAVGDTEGSVVRNGVAAAKGESSVRTVRQSSLTKLPSSVGTGDNELVATVNTGLLLEMLTKNLDTVAAANAEPGAPASPASAVLKASGFGAFDRLFISATAEPNIMNTAMYATMTAEPTGLVKAWADSGPTTLSKLSYVPADAHGFTSFSLNVGGLYSSILEVVDAAQPGASAMAMMFMLGQQSELGIDILGGILANISGEHLFIQRPLDADSLRRLQEAGTPMGNSTSIFIGLQNGDVVTQNLNTLLEKLTADPNTAGGLKVEVNEQVTLVRIETPEMMDAPVSPGAGYSKDAIFIASNQPEVQQSSRVLQGTNPAPIMATASVKAMVDGVDRDRLMAFSYTSSQGLTSWLDQIRDAIRNGSLPAMGPFAEVTADDLPSGATVRRYLGEGLGTAHIRDGYIVFNNDLRGTQ